ncbi:MAG: type II toxin-antitoxin system VapC family toxin [Leifsonia sp.]
MIVYVESSAAVKLFGLEPEADALVGYLDELAGDAATTLVSSAILETEVRRAAVRAELAQSRATAILDRFEIVDLDRSVYTAAGVLPGRQLRSLDALHIAAAFKVDAEVMLSYDTRQIAAAQAAGLRTLSPA